MNLPIIMSVRTDVPAIHLLTRGRRKRIDRDKDMSLLGNLYNFGL